ncbi:MAG: LCP family protein [Agathobacter sp.]|uniref:LCP family protein n=1 Tax=Agathobacter sp. TaxID=2021311 RepID=UPI00257B5A56|nr:LCP family protein [Agathobacter sp.]MBQ1680588.1 LCP family protein [Agathobacter sp.]
MATYNRTGNRRYEERRRQQLRKQKKRKRKIAVFFTEVMILAVVLIGIYVISLIGKINFKKFSEKDAGINKDIADESMETMKGYQNIALFGLDNRSAGNYTGGNSDTIMIASINHDTKEVKLVSVFRDTVLHIGDGKYKKANSAFSNGGAQQAVAMLNSNLDLNITDYLCVDWAALVEVIDDLGGLELNVTAEEVGLLNTYLRDVDNVTGKDTSHLSGSGVMHLDGTQAVCYARIRKTAGDDFLRTSRQRIVLQAMLDKVKTADVATLLSICNDTFDDIATSLSLKQLLSLAKNASAFQITASTGFPFTVATPRLDGLGSVVVPCTLETNVSKLHEFLFGEEGYHVSASVSSTNNAIINMSGIRSEEDAMDISRYNNTIGADGTYFKDQPVQ